MLRPYQQECIDAIKHEWFEEEHSRTLGVLPTASGKTIIAAGLIQDLIDSSKRVLFLAHRNELINQAYDKIKSFTGIECAIEKAEETSIGKDNKVVVGSIQTLCRESRLSKFPKDYFDMIIVDECHHILADSYMTILNHFNEARVLGITATPDRGDQKNLGQFFDSKAYEYTMAQGIKDGWLSPIKAQMIPLQLDIHDVSITQGDYNAGQIGSALEPYLNQIALEMLKYCKDRKTVVFLPLVKTSQKFCDLLNLYGMRAVEVNGNSKDRDQILADFEAGEYDVLCNSMLLTEGWDCPSVDCIIVLRPTKVRSLYQQMVGRGLRIAPGKKDLLLLDFLWMTERHDLCRPSVLVSKDADIAERVNQKIVDSGAGIDLIFANESAEKDIIAEREATLARELAAMRKRQLRLVDPIQYAFSIEAEDLARYQPTFVWEMGPVTEKQKDYLEKHGILADTIENCGLASLIIDKLKKRQMEGLATPKQIRYLESRGFRHVGTWSFDDATDMINRIASNNWFIPRGINAATYQP
jgi:superfamily II DNA or RNA helicase